MLAIENGLKGTLDAIEQLNPRVDVLNSLDDYEEFHANCEYIKSVLDSVGPDSVQLLEYAQTVPLSFPDDPRLQEWVEYLQQQYCLADIMTQIQSVMDWGRDQWQQYAQDNLQWYLDQPLPDNPLGAVDFTETGS